MPTMVGVMADSYKAPAGGWTPASLTGLALWLDASDTATITHSSNAVSQWNDKSGNARHHTQATAGNKPTTGTRTINSLNVVDFDGTNDYLAYTWTVVNQPLTIAAVVQSDVTTASTARIYGRGTVTAFNLGRSVAGTTWHYSAGTTRTGGTLNTSAHVVVGCYSDTASRLRVDGSQVHDGTSSSPGTNGFTAAASIGGRDDGTQPWDGAIAEVVITSTNLNGTGDLTSLEAYLKAKWNTP